MWPVSSVSEPFLRCFAKILARFGASGYVRYLLLLYSVATSWNHHSSTVRFPNHGFFVVGVVSCEWGLRGAQLTTRGLAASLGGHVGQNMDPRQFCILNFRPWWWLCPDLSSQPSQAYNFRCLDFLPVLKSVPRVALQEDGWCKVSGSCDLKSRIYRLERVWIAPPHHVNCYIIRPK